MSEQRPGVRSQESEVRRKGDGSPGRSSRPRYTLGERVYHAMQAYTTMFLLISGGIILLGRPGQAVRAALSRYHLAVGLAAMVALAATALIIRGRTLHNLAWAMIVERKDLMWWWYMLTLRPLRAHRLPTGRFNPGQKAELLGVPVSFILLLASGLMMWWKPTILWPRYFHVAAACLLVGLLSVHLYMTLIHPPTRPSLQLMWTAGSNPEWERKHYPRGRARPRALWLASGAWTGAVTAGLVLAAAAGAHGTRRFAPRVLMPGPLVEAHAFLENDCAACHVERRGLSDARCVACHEKAGGESFAWPARFAGHHADADLDCLDCHADHRGRAGASTARLPADQWDAISCELCHRDSDAIVAAFDGRFDSAHAVHRHGGVACTECHGSHFARDDRVSALSATRATCAACHHGPGNVPDAVAAVWQADPPPTRPEPAGGPGDFSPVARPASDDASCLRCHQVEAAMLAGRYEPLGLLADADPMSGKVRCDQCHRFDRERATWAEATDACARCHRATEPDDAGGLRFAYRELGRRRAARSAQAADRLCEKFDPDRPLGPGLPTARRVLEDLRRGGPHNFELAERIIRTLDALPPTAPRIEVPTTQGDLLVRGP